MAAINFPSSPSNGDTHVVDGVTYTYNSAEAKWKTTINSNAFLPLSGGTVSGNLNVSGDVTVDTDTLYVDSTNNRVGVGVTNPGALLEVNGNGLFRAPTGSGTLNIVSGNNVINAGNKIAFFGANRFEADEEMAYIKPLLTSNSGGAGNVQTGHLTFGTSGSERARITSGGAFHFNNGYGSVAIAYGVRAWCNANTMSANTFNGSGNVSSITDNGSGDYTVNFTTSMPDTGYAVVAMGFEFGSTGTSDGYFTVERAINYSDSMATGSVTVKTNSGGDRNLNLVVVR